MQTVLLCAGEDELELVGLVHRARQRGLALEVVTGVDASEEPMLFAMQRSNPGLFVLVRTGSLTSNRARELKTRFLDTRVSDQHLLALKFDADRIEDMVEGIRRRITRIDQAVPTADTTGSMPLHRDSLDPMFTPLIDRQELASLDPDVTERHKMAHSAEEETTRSVVQYYRKDGSQGSQPRRKVMGLLVGLGVAAAAAGGYFAYEALTATSSTEAEGSTADVPETEPAYPGTDVRVPTLEPDEAPEEPQEPKKPHLRRRTTPRSGH